MTSTDLSALIQVQRSTVDIHAAQQAVSSQTSQQSAAEAKDAANQFEALLIHNMLKSMRKTTLAEGTSNQRALYDDMLDQRIAEQMVKAGGIGIADQLMKQLHRDGPSNNKAPDDTAPTTAATLKLRELAMNIRPSANASPDASSASSAAASTAHLDSTSMVNRLWANSTSHEKTTPFHSQEDFLNTLKPYAERTAERLGTTANTVLAIAALETGWGKHMLKDEKGNISNNYFGIKATPNDNAFTRNTTTEYLNGKSQNVMAHFKSYDSTADSLNGFATFLLENPRYSTALQHANNPERFIRELHQAGYATDPDYANKAISVMKQVEQQTSTP